MLFGNNANNEEIQQDSLFQSYLRSRRIAKATLSRRELQELSNVKCFISSHFASFASYISVITVFFCMGYMGWGRDVKGSYTEISGQYQTLITPVLWVNLSSWVLIFVSEAFLIVFSFLESFEHSSIVQNGIGYNFFFVNCCQIGWMVSYTFDIMWLAFTWMTASTILLIWLNLNIYYTGHIDQTPRFPEGQMSMLPRNRTILNENEGEVGSMTVVYEWLVFRLPFQLHLGWAIFLLLVGLNELAISMQWTFTSQIALLSVIILWIIGIFVLFYPTYPVFIIPIMISWAAAGVWINLLQPTEAVTELYETMTINRVFGGIITTCIEHAIIAIIRFIAFFADSYSIFEKERT